MGLQWGRSGFTPWLPDSIEGIQITGNLPNMFGTWTHKYPRGYFLMNGVFYAPLMDYWTTHPVMEQLPDGSLQPTPIDIPRLDTLALITRWLAVVLSTATVFGVAVVVRKLFDDDLAGILAGMALGFAPLYVYNASSGSVDVPVLFFFVWTAYFAVKASQTNRWRYYLLMGVGASWGVCTKEGAAIYFAGLGLVLWALLIEQGLKARQTFKQVVSSVLSSRMLAALGVALAVFLVLNGFLGGPDEFLTRMKFWQKAVVDYSTGYRGQIPLLWKSCRELYNGIGWPFMAVWLAGIVYFAIRYPWKLWIGMAPLLLYYVTTIARIHLVMPRYLMAGYVGMALMVSVTLADLYRWLRWPAFLRRILLGTVFVVPFLYGIGIGLEMFSDTRIRAENWIKSHTDQNALIGAAIVAPYYPRLGFDGYNMIPDWHSQGVPVDSTLRVIWPDYLILSTEWPCVTSKPDDAFREKLYKDETPYRKVAQYDVRYLYPARSVFGWATWPFEQYANLSPMIMIYAKKNLVREPITVDR